MGFEEFVGASWRVKADGGSETGGDMIEIAVSVVCRSNPAHATYGLGTYQPDPQGTSAPGTIVGPGYTISLTRATPMGDPAEITYSPTSVPTGSWTANDTSGVG